MEFAKPPKLEFKFEWFQHRGKSHWQIAQEYFDNWYLNTFELKENKPVLEKEERFEVMQSLGLQVFQIEGISHLYLTKANKVEDILARATKIYGENDFNRNDSLWRTKQSEESNRSALMINIQQLPKKCKDHRPDRYVPSLVGPPKAFCQCGVELFAEWKAK